MGRLSTRWLWLGIALLLLLSPLGLLAEGVAWAEWGADELGQIVGFVPEGLAALGDLWPAPAPDYSLGPLDTGPAYILSGLLGVAVVAGATWLVGHWLSRGGNGG